MYFSSAGTWRYDYVIIDFFLAKNWFHIKIQKENACKSFLGKCIYVSYIRIYIYIYIYIFIYIYIYIYQTTCYNRKLHKKNNLFTTNAAVVL